MGPINTTSSYVQLEFYVFHPGQQILCPGYVVLVDMYVPKVKRYGLQRQVYLPRHQIKVVNVRRQPKVGIAASLVGRHHQFTFVYLKLHKAKARSLVAFHPGSPQEQHVVLTVALLRVDFGNKRRQLLKICRVAIHQGVTAIIPPCYTYLAVSFHVALTLHKQAKFCLQLLSRNTVALEYVEQVTRSKRQPLIQKIPDTAFLVYLEFTLSEYFAQHLVILVHRSFPWFAQR